ncbi:MAG: AAA-like domain-containing protein [Cyanobacteria bacterium P01_F01_bin.150]
MNPEDALLLLDTIIKPKHLNATQELVFHHCWSGKTYLEISQISGYDPDYIRVIGSKLWNLLSSELGEKVTKHNFRAVLREQLRKPEFSDIFNIADKSANKLKIKDTDQQRPPVSGSSHARVLQKQRPMSEAKVFPSGPLPLHSSLYIERPKVEEYAYDAITQQGMLLRIKAAQKMGKTSLMLRLLDYASSQQMRTVRLNFCQADEAHIQSIDSLLQWFCANISQQLKLDADPSDCWNEVLGSKISATFFLRDYILEPLSAPIVIALDDVDWLFQYETVARDFLLLLRLWHEESNNMGVWQNLRLILVYCTEKLSLLNANHALFNIGIPIELGELDYDRCLKLTSHYQSFFPHDLSIADVTQRLYSLVKGHPHLLRLALYHLTQRRMALEEIVQNAPTQEGFYRTYLQKYLITIQQNPALAEALSKIIQEDNPVQVDVPIAYQLYSLGLITFAGNHVRPRCELYRQYFQSQLNEVFLQKE